MRRFERSARRALRLRRRHARFVYHRGYQLRLPGLPLDPLRGERILNAAGFMGLASSRRIYAPSPASLETLQRAHDSRYLERLRTGDGVAEAVGFEPTDHQRTATLDYQRLVCGGSILATELALAQPGVVFHLGGGLHHAGSAVGAQFCLLNDVAVAVTNARAAGYAGRILVLDLDLHDGAGTRDCLGADERVDQLSVHAHTRTVPTAPQHTAIELGTEIQDADYLEAVSTAVDEQIARQSPELVYYLAGTDVAATDPTGQWQLAPDTVLERDLRVFERLAQLENPPAIALLLAGGYGNETWRYTARTIGHLLSPQPVDLPPTAELTFGHYHELIGEQIKERPEDDWLSSSEILDQLDGVPHEHAFLGFLPAEKLTEIFTTSGLVDRLRDLGFNQPQLELDLDSPTGQTLFVFGDHRGETLAELRALRDRSTAEGYEFLRIEWLLLQNPREQFTPERPQLPGQAHPGLGLLHDTVAMLLLVAQELDLDGVLFVPSHYHIALQSAGVARFLEPHRQGWFRRLNDKLSRLPLTKSIEYFSSGRIQSADGTPVRWQPAPMIVPLTERATSLVTSRRYREAENDAYTAAHFAPLAT